MRITRCGAEPAPWSLTAFSDLEAAPADCMACFAGAARTNFQSSLAWYRTVIRAALPAGASARFVVCRRGADPVALFPLQVGPHGALQSLTTPYTHLYEPLIDPAAGNAALRQAGRLFGRYCRGWSTLRLDALDPAGPALTPLLAGVHRAGLVTQLFDHFGNWHAAVRGLSWDAYLAARPGALRETVRRKLRRSERDPKIHLDLVTAPEAVAAATDAYEDVYRRSWKDAEPFPQFSAALMQAAAALGVLRLGVLRYDGQAVAAQYWIVVNGCATVLKLAHDDGFARLSPGTVLTAHMIRALLDREHVEELDFGRGDDGYKQLWTDHRRQRIGVLVINPLRPAGLAALAGQVLGRGRRAVRRARPES